MAQMEFEEFEVEMKEYVADIIQSAFTNIEVSDILKSLYKKCEGNPAEAHDEVIHEVIEELGGEPYDPSAEEADDVEKETDEGDY